MKKLMTMLLALCMTASLLTGMVGAYTAEEQNEADALNHLGLFLGTGQGYELDAKLDRSQSVMLLVRMLGKLETAEKGSDTNPFTDVPKWADKVVSYAYTNGLVKGYGPTTFGGKDTVSDYQYLTMVLRALGYDDSAETPDFNWRKSRELAKELKLVDSTADDANFDRGSAVDIFWKALNTNCKGSTKTLAAHLIEQGVFTQAQFDEAAKIAKNGLKTGSNTGTTGNNGNPGNNGSNNGNSSTEEKKPEDYTWEEYQAMSAEEQYKFFESFSDPKDFFAWQEKAKADYEKRHPTIEVGKDGTVDIGDLINGNN